MALPASDAFTGADSSLLSASWTHLRVTDNAEISSNMAKSITGEEYIYWNADSFNDEHKSTITIGASGQTDIGCIVCASGSEASTPTARNFYYCIISGTDVFIGRCFNSGGLVDIGAGSSGNSWTTGDTLTFEHKSNGDLVAKKNGGSAFYTENDTTLSGGAPGCIFLASTGRIDAWTGDNLGSGGFAYEEDIGLFLPLPKPSTIVGLWG